MNYNIINTQRYPEPAVGQIWKHTGSNEHVYIRIPVEQGAKAIGKRPGCFYSVSLMSGNIVATVADAAKSYLIAKEPIDITF